MAASTPLAFYAATGLETALFARLMTAAGVALVRDDQERFAFYVGAAFLTRPEAGLLAAIGVTWLLARGRGNRSRLARVAGVVARMGVIVVPYLAFKLWYFGALLPNTLAAKPPQLREGITYVAWLLPELLGLLIVAGVGAVPASASGGRRVSRSGALAGLFVVHLFAVALEGGDWMRFGRLVVPYLGWLAIAVDPRLSALLVDLSRGRFRALALLAPAATYLPLTLLDLRQMDDYATADAVDELRARTARELVAAGVRSVATFDIGVIGYAAPELEIIDLAGLTDRAIGRLPGTHYEKRPTPSYLEARKPMAFLIASKTPFGPSGPSDAYRLECYYPAEQCILDLPWFRARYHHQGLPAVHSRYFIHWFAENLVSANGEGTEARTPG